MDVDQERIAHLTRGLECMAAALWSVAKTCEEAMPRLSPFTGLLAILNGHSGPPRLCIDGREYHRRQRRRTKRNRRR